MRVTSLGLGAWTVPQKLQTGRKWLPVQPPRPPVTLWQGRDGEESSISDCYLQHFCCPWLAHLPRHLWPGRGTKLQKTLCDIHILNYRHIAIQASLAQNAGNTLKSNEITREKQWSISNMLQMITAINPVRPEESG